MENLIRIEEAAKQLDSFPKRLEVYCNSHNIKLYTVRTKLYMCKEDMEKVEKRMVRKKSQAYVTIRINDEDFSYFGRLTQEEIVNAVEGNLNAYLPYVLGENQVRVNIVMPKEVRENAWKKNNGLKIVRHLILVKKHKDKPLEEMIAKEVQRYNG